MASTAVVKDIVIYPIKSCQGISLAAAAVTPLGFAFDRRWMVVSEGTGKFLSLRQNIKLGHINPSLPTDVLTAADGSLPADAALILTAPGMVLPLSIPLKNPAGSLKPCTIWEWSGSGLDEGDVAAAWVSEALGQPCRLVRYAGNTPTFPEAAAAVNRPTDPTYAAGGQVAFADGFPVLVATEESLADLNKRLVTPIDMSRFRPNLILSLGGGPGWQEDTWASVKQPSSGLALQLVKPCDRCKVPTINLKTGEVEDEPLKSLKELRSGKVLGWAEEHKSWTHSVFFGWNAVPSSSGSIKVGDVLELVAK